MSPRPLKGGLRFLAALLSLTLGEGAFAQAECPDPISPEVVGETLDLAPPLILGFQHEDAQRRLISLEVNLTCTNAPTQAPDLARLWYYRAIADLYALEATGVPSAEKLEEVVNRFALARSIDPELEWEKQTFGPFGEELWSLSSPDNRDVKGVMVGIQGEGRVFIDGVPYSGGESISLAPGRHLIQTATGQSFKGAWIDIDPEGPPITIAAALGGALRQGPSPQVAEPAIAPVSQPSPRPAPQPSEAATPSEAAPPSEGQQPPSLPDLIARSPLGAGELTLALNAWSFPNLFAGPSLTLTLPREGAFYGSIGAGLGYGALRTCDGCRPAEGVTAIIPLSLEAGARVGDSERLQVGVGYRGYFGGGFGTALEVAQGEGARAAHGVEGVVGVRGGASLPLKLSLSGGILLSPEAMVGFMGGVSLGVILGGDNS